MSKLGQLLIDYEDKKTPEEPWEYVDMPPAIPSVPAGPSAEQWRILSEAERKRMVEERGVIKL